MVANILKATTLSYLVKKSIDSNACEQFTASISVILGYNRRVASHDARYNCIRTTYKIPGLYLGKEKPYASIHIILETPWETTNNVTEIPRLPSLWHLASK